MSILASITSALLDAGLDLTAPEVVDVLWFARHVGADVQAAAESPAESALPDPLTRPQPVPEPSPDPNVSERDDDPDEFEDLVEVPDPAGEEQSTGLHVASGDRGAGSGPRSGLGMRVPGVAALHDPLLLSRALRPLMRRRPSRTAFLLDEIGTVERIADMRVIIPHMRPAPARWFELALIVDKSASMAVWQSTIQEFRRLLERQGAFRDVRSWGMMTDFTDGVVRLYPGLGPIDPSRTTHKPGELVDPTGRRITLVISDCVSPAWHDGEMATILAQWQRSGPLAIVQMLPEHVWEATGLGGAADADLTATLPGALNSQLRVSVQDLWYESRRADLAVPIVQLNPRSLRDWSALVMGSARSRVAGRIFHLPETKADPGGADPMNNNDATPSRETRTDPSNGAQPKHRDADQLVGNFRALVSKQARQLGGVLATIPVLTLPLMRVVQATLLPATNVTHLAELFIGGILRERQENAHLLDPEIVEYTFVPGVSELLIKSVSSYDAIAALSLFFERHLGRPINFFALLEDPSKAVGLLGLDEESESFAALTVGTLRRLGGSFARVAAELEKAAIDGGVPGSPGNSSGDAQPAGGNVSRKVTKRPPTDAERIGMLVSRAEQRTVEGKYQPAESSYKRALEIAERIWGSNNQQTALIMQQLATVLQAQNKNDEAYELYETSFAVVRSLDSVDQLQLALMSNNFGTFLQAQGRYDQAEQSFRRALEIRLGKLGPHDPLVAISQNNLAVLLGIEKRNEAIRLFRQALAILEHAIGYEEVFRRAVNNFVRLLIDLRDYDEAMNLNRRFSAFIDRNVSRQIEIEQRRIRQSTSQYTDFELEIEPGSAGHYLVRVESSAGRDRATLTLPTDQPAYGEFMTNLAYNLPTTRSQEREFGRLLYDTLIQGSIRENFRAARDEAKRNNQILRIKLSINPNLEELAAVAAVPWEFAVNDTGVPISTEYSFCRFLARAVPLPKLRIAGATIKVLLTSALPKELAEKFPINIEGEVAAIRAALKPLEDQGALAVVELPHLTWRKLQKAIENEQPHIIHYVGHGVFEDGVGSLVLENANGSRQDLSAPALASTLRLSGTRLLVLDAAHTATVETNLLGCIALSLSDADIPAVIGWQFGMSDESGLVFAEDFYQNLAEDKPIDTCVSRGRRAIRNSTATRDWGLITLYMRTPDGILFERLGDENEVTAANQSPAMPMSTERNIIFGLGNNFSGGNIVIGNSAGQALNQSSPINQTTSSESRNLSSSSGGDRHEHLKMLRTTLKERLYNLELQEAKFGKLYTPLYLSNQLRETRAELAQVEAELQQLGG
jgi:tetratricopeptide (TPR) repeat protein